MPTDGVTFVTSDVAKWGAGKGTPLTASEADNDLWELLHRLRTLEDNPPTAVSISNISVIGTQVQFNMSNGTHFGPFTLPIATFQLRGNFVPGVHYNELDIVAAPGFGLFLVRLAHDGENPFNPAAVDIGGNAMYLKLFGEDSYIYDFGFSALARPGQGIDVDAAMGTHIFVRVVTLPVGLVGSKAKMTIAPAFAMSFPILKNGVNIGSLDFAAGAVDGTFTFATQTSFAVDDVLSLIRNATIDGSARELSVTFSGTRFT